MIRKGKSLLLNLDERTEKQASKLRFLASGQAVPGVHLTKAYSVHFPNDFQRLEVDVSSLKPVFLGLDHSFGSGPPLLFETMIFPTGDNDEYQTRAETREQALEQHITAIESLLRYTVK